MFTLKNPRALIAKAALATGLVLSFSSPAHAVTKCGSNSGESNTIGGDNSNFWSYYAIKMITNVASKQTCLNTQTDFKRHFNIKWTMEAADANLVTGMGWKFGDTRTVNYNYSRFNGNGTSYMALYGWACGSRFNELQEYYVVETYPGTSFKPFGAGGTWTKTVNGSTYDYYITLRPQGSGNACSASQPSATRAGPAFYQYWAVRRNKRAPQAAGAAAHVITFATHTAEWSAGTRGFRTDWLAGGYEIMGVEAFGRSTGELDLTSWK